MSCGCASAKDAPEIPGAEFITIPHYQLKNETIECFMKRVGPQEPAPEPAPPIKDKIATLSIPVDCEMKVDTTFTMTEGSKSVTWQFEMKDETGAVVQPSAFGLTYDNGTGKLSGTFSKQYEKKKITAHMKALAAEPNNDVEPHLNVGDVVDEKEYEIVPKICDKSDLRFTHPNPGARLTCGFGPRKPPTSGASSNHKGCDFSTHGSANILASADGVVSKAGVGTGYGNVVYIDHKDAGGKLLAQTRYAHLSQIYVRVGQTVSAGTPIGHEGNTGVGTGPHLHFEILMGGTTAVDPLKYINGSITVDPGAINGAVDPAATPGPTTTVVNKDKGMTQEEVAAKTECKPQEIQEAASATDRAPKPGPILPGGKCMPDGWVPPTREQVAVEIRNEARAAGASDPQIRYLLKIAHLESSYNQYASNPKSSALGLFQMLDGTAAVWFAAIGVRCTCENRCNVKYATQAMVKMVKYEEKGYNSSHPGGVYNPNGGVAGANKGAIANNAYTARYGALSYEEFMYLEHGQGNEGMRRGTPNGSDFYNHFKSHAPNDSVIDGYMNA